jgi:hypothetical protein
MRLLCSTRDPAGLRSRREDSIGIDTSALNWVVEACNQFCLIYLLLWVFLLLGIRATAFVSITLVAVVVTNHTSGRERVSSYRVSDYDRTSFLLWTRDFNHAKSIGQRFAT